MNLDERFTDFTDAITEKMGNWRTTFVMCLLRVIIEFYGSSYRGAKAQHQPRPITQYGPYKRVGDYSARFNNQMVPLMPFAEADCRFLCEPNVDRKTHGSMQALSRRTGAQLLARTLCRSRVETAMEYQSTTDTRQATQGKSSKGERSAQVIFTPGTLWHQLKPIQHHVRAAKWVLRDLSKAISYTLDSSCRSRPFFIYSARVAL